MCIPLDLSRSFIPLSRRTRFLRPHLRLPLVDPSLILVFSFSALPKYKVAHNVRPFLRFKRRVSQALLHELKEPKVMF